LLPDTAKEKPKQGKVLSLVTANCFETASAPPSRSRKADRVLFTSYSGNEVQVDGDEYLIMSEDDILAVID